MKKILEKNVAEMIVVTLVTIVLMSSCGVSSPHHACGITPLNKQYSKTCR
tara:strand:+ start:574 stop:723 length:150 start_codon:yes stop_codon:yes gene_type:complete